MVKKMCPVCDLPVSGGNYCPRCKKIIRKPYTQNVDYYLNERHPEYETECGFHNPYLEADHHGESESAARPVSRPQQGAGRSVTAAGGQMPGQTGRLSHSGRQVQTGQSGQQNHSGQPGRQVQSGQQSQPGQGRPSGVSPSGPVGGTGSQPGQYRQPGTGASGPYRTASGGYGTGSMNGGARPAAAKDHSVRNILVTVGVSFVLIALLSLVNIGKALYENIPETTEYADIYDYESYYTELTDEEIMDAGVACMGYSHFQADGIYVGEQFLNFIMNSEYDFTLDSDELYEDNYLYEEVSYFESVRSFYLSDEASQSSDDEYVYQYVDLNYDTVTGEIHDYTSCIYNSAAALDFLELFLTSVEDSFGLGASDRRADAIMEEAREIVTLGQNSYIYDGMFAIEIYQSENEDSIYITVYYNDAAGAVASEL